MSLSPVGHTRGTAGPRGHWQKHRFGAVSLVGVTPFLLQAVCWKKISYQLELGIYVISERPLQPPLHQQTPLVQLRLAEVFLLELKLIPQTNKANTGNWCFLTLFLNFFLWPVHLPLLRTSGARRTEGLRGRRDQDLSPFEGASFGQGVYWEPQSFLLSGSEAGRGAYLVQWM